MEADLDLGDKLRASNKELSGDKLIDEQYTSQKLANFQISYSNMVQSSAMDPLLNRPITPSQYRHSRMAHTIDSFANSLSIGDSHNHHNYEYESKVFANPSQKPLSVSHTPSISNDQEKPTKYEENFDENTDREPSASTHKATPIMKNSFDEPQRSHSSASDHSSASSAIESDNENIDKQS